MPGNSEFRLTACINSPAIFSIKIRSVSYPGLTLCNFLMLGIASILMLKLQIPKERRKGSLGVHRSCSLPKILSIKSYTGKESCKSILSCTLKKKPSSSSSSGNGGKKESSHCEQTQTFSAQNFHGVLFFLPTSYTSSEEIKFRPFSVLHPNTSLLHVQKSIRHCRRFLFKMQVKKQRCVEVRTTSNKARIFCYGSMFENVFSS